ncbi:catalase family peroxidase [Pseudomonas chlororaphis]|uniref:catalase family peroxidase n=1 Tax=Pseudomonas chlororaphis TaxID=587753 RepID=UPI0003D3B197|nr:catalase family peroxidase [Pseudomonas chlororaphis]AZD30821.1 Catalase-like heme-binding protein [Pseudomonas chlororaphis]ETD34947.1 catalase [Pseudomonas chlororaphis subsp. aurantiaca PB-St2]QFS56170.1 catalase [Pseudomonas chlororaphis subsp. aurantiaca]
MSELNLKSRYTWGALAMIFAIVGGMTAAFAWTAGLIGTRPTTQALVEQPPPSFPAGFRRAHGKGICFVGAFRADKAAGTLSTARVFSQPTVPVVGRFSIGTGDPHAADSSTNTVSMALLLVTNDQQQWRMAMNNQPYFATRDAQGFLAMQKATAVEPATGKPDPNRLATFLKAYPEAKKFLDWSEQAPSPGSFAGVDFYGVNAFFLVASDGDRQPVRWTMRAHEPFTALGGEQLQMAGHDFLFDDLRQTLSQHPLYWDLVMQLAQPGDPLDDPSQPWPQERKQVVAGTLEVTGVVEQAEGACRDVNFDPSIVPAGIEVSDDPVLSARSGAYSRSFNMRLSEIGHGKATEAVGKPEEK